MSTYKAAVLGDKDSIYGFASLGFAIFPIEDSLEAIKTIRRLSDSGYAVIYITEYLAAQIPQEIERYASLALPAIIPIPGIKGNTGMGMKNVSKSVEKAVGSDILGDA
ncbi:MAG TPA: V-type ATP synthase subunit F [Clostridiales bacterium]|jgi:V/A-type H+-transporting ATPase subunit F|nr:V-type ATP synthase subunit F [Clostridiales bacterium]HRT82815.1 V-type ATP synthase subunit F [Oscillospiraceae bacterium]